MGKWYALSVFQRLLAITFVRLRLSALVISVLLYIHERTARHTGGRLADDCEHHERLQLHSPASKLDDNRTGANVELHVP
jgi:hypothetical protein